MQSLYTGQAFYRRDAFEHATNELFKEVHLARRVIKQNDMD